MSNSNNKGGNVRLTIAPLAASAANDAEFCDSPGAFYRFGLRRSMLYASMTGCALLILLGTTWAFSRIAGPRPGLGVLFAGGLVALSGVVYMQWRKLAVTQPA